MNLSYGDKQVSNLSLKGTIFSIKHVDGQSHGLVGPGLLGKQHFCKTLLSMHTEIGFSVLGLQHVSLSLVCSSTSAIFERDNWAFCGLFSIFPPCEIPTDWIKERHLLPLVQSCQEGK